MEKSHIINGFFHMEISPDHVTTNVRHSAVVGVEKESFKSKRNFCASVDGGKKSPNA